MTNDELMTKSEETREDSFWLDGETSLVREESEAKPICRLEALEGGALRRQLRELGSRELAPPVPQVSRMREV